MTAHDRPLPLRPPERSRAFAFALLVADHWPDVLNVGGGAMLGAQALYEDELWLTITGVVAFCLGQYGTLRRAPTLRRLQQEREELRHEAGKHVADYRQLVDAYLFRLSRPLEYDTNHRISLYRHEQGRFVCVGRHSAHSTYHQLGGQAVHPGDYGHLRRAWDEGVAFQEKLPDPQVQPAKWVDALRHAFGFSDDDIAGLSMPSRSIAAFAVRDGSSGRALGVVVFESLEPDGLSLNLLRHLMRGDEGNDLARFLGSPRAPSLAFAIEKGFG